MTEFTLEDLHPDLSPTAREIICGVILAWARLDSLVSQLFLLAFGLSLDGGTILLGSMDTRTKLDRLKKLYDHHGMDEAARSIANLRLAHKGHVDIRNSIAHHTCAGTWKSEPDMIVFAPVRALQGKLDHVEVEHIPLSAMIRASDFAEKASNALMQVNERLSLRRALSPPAPPWFDPPSPPSPPKRGVSAQPRQPKASQR